MTRVELKYDEYIEKIAQLLPKEKAPVVDCIEFVCPNCQHKTTISGLTDHIHYTEGK